MSATRQLRATHWSRYVDATFLIIWMMFWVVGEVVAIVLVVVMIASALSAALGRPPLLASWAPPTDGSVTLFLFFLLIWLTLWTVGGIAAGTQLLRRLGGEDSIEITGNVLSLTWRAGPIRRRREIPRASIRRIRIQLKGGAVVADTDTGTVEISDLGNAEERRELHQWLGSQLGLAGEDHARLREREMRPLERDVETHGYRDHRHPPDPADTSQSGARDAAGGRADVVGMDRCAPPRLHTLRRLASLWPRCATMLVAASSLWFLSFRTEWTLRQGRMAVRRRVAHWTLREHEFSASSTIELEHHVDSDGDDRYKLVIKDSTRRRVLSSALDDQHELLALGEWLSARTGFTFKR